MLRFYFLIGLLFSLLFGVTTPPFQVLDEHHHFFRAYQISEGTFISTKVANQTGDQLPTSLFQLFEAVKTGEIAWNNAKKFDPEWLGPLFQKKLEPETRMFLNFPNTALYSPVNYLPQSLAILLGRTLSLSPLAILYLVRIITCIAALSILFFAIRTLTTFKYTLFSILLWPMVIFSAPSCSADIVNITLSFLVFILVMSGLEKLSTQKQTNLKDSHWILVSVIMGLLLLCKPIYIVYGPLVVYYLWQKGKSLPPRQAYLCWFISISLLGLFFALFVVWSQIGFKLFSQLKPYGIIDISQQKAYILENPWTFIALVYSDFFNGITNKDYLTTAVGIYLGWGGGAKLNQLIIFGILGVTLLSALCDKPFSFPHQRALKMGSLLLFFIGVGLISFTLYLSWNSVASPQIEGVHGRYFIPLLPLLLWPLCGLWYPLIRRYPYATKILPLLTILAAPLWLLYAWFIVYQRYY